ncbi:hypothetical protein Tco_0677329 [Tanacetum coccineum]|uniref:Uncharacterized protein n=1 Tax=Tanacetum coccineum TaxID=301880 RepID=A0ABQ4XCK2_9ASTR
MVVCTYGEDDVVRTSWTNRNPGRVKIVFILGGLNPPCVHVLWTSFLICYGRTEDLVEITEERAENTQETKSNMDQRRANLEHDMANKEHDRTNRRRTY